MATLTRQEFLALPWADQKEADFRKVFDPATDVDLTINCIQPGHRDTIASMVIYDNAVYCHGCKVRYWPDQFLRSIGDTILTDIRRGSRPQAAPKFIPLAQADTYRRWLWSPVSYDGHYAGRAKWLTDRGLTRETCYPNFIGHTGEAFTIPVFGDGGGVRSIRYRRDDELAGEDRPKYWGTAGANDAMLYIPRRSFGSKDKLQYGVLLCEGELDALRLRQEGYPAVSLTNGCNALKAEHIVPLTAYARSLGTTRVTVAYDQDLPGTDAAHRAVRLLGSAHLDARYVIWDLRSGKDVTEYLSAHPWALGIRLETLWRSA